MAEKTGSDNSGKVSGASVVLAILLYSGLMHWVFSGAIWSTDSLKAIGIVAAVVAGIFIVPRLLGMLIGALVLLFTSKAQRARWAAAEGKRQALRDDFHAQMRRDEEAKTARLMHARSDQLGPH